MMTDDQYTDIYDLIQEAGFTAGICVHNGNCVGIEIECPALQGGVRKKIVEDIVGSEYRVVFFPNEEILAVKKRGQ